MSGENCSLKEGWHCATPAEITPFSLVPAENMTCDGTRFIHEGTPINCTLCVFPSRCLSNNSCVWGATGQTCERCLSLHTTDTPYVRVGNACVPCHSFPWPLLVSLALIIILAIVVKMEGLTVSIATKVKQLCHFLQLLLLVLTTRGLHWSPALLHTARHLTAASLDQQIQLIACHWAVGVSLVQVQVTVTFLVFAALLVVSVVLDKKKMLGGVSLVSPGVTWLLWERESQGRRVAALCLLCLYVPVSLMCLYTEACSRTLAAYKPFQDLVLSARHYVHIYDQDMFCSTPYFQTLAFVSLVFVAFIILFPFLLIFYTLVQRKWKRLAADFPKHGTLYESYKTRFCFMEGVVLLRKLTAVAAAHLYPFPVSVVLNFHVTVTSLYLLVCIVFRPLRPRYWTFCPFLDLHNSFEVLVNVTLLLVLVSGLHSAATSSPHPALDGLALTMVALTLAYWLITLCLVRAERQMPLMEDGWGDPLHHWSTDDDDEVDDEEDEELARMAQRQNRRRTVVAGGLLPGLADFTGRHSTAASDDANTRTSSTSSQIAS